MVLQIQEFHNVFGDRYWFCEIAGSLKGRTVIEINIWVIACKYSCVSLGTLGYDSCLIYRKCHVIVMTDIIHMEMSCSNSTVIIKLSEFLLQELHQESEFFLMMLCKRYRKISLVRKLTGIPNYVNVSNYGQQV